MAMCSCSPAYGGFSFQGLSVHQKTEDFSYFSVLRFPDCTGYFSLKAKWFSFSSQAKIIRVDYVKCSEKQARRLYGGSEAVENRKETKKVGRKEHHLWKRKDSAGSGQKALDLVRTLSGLPNEKEVVYGALNKWVAWETEFPLIAAAKALKILRKRSQWRRVIQVAKWMLSKGQGATMGTYDTLLLAFDMDRRADEAESLWNMILHTHTRSIPRRLFSRIIALYDHHDLPDKIIELQKLFKTFPKDKSLPKIDLVVSLCHGTEVLVFADMEELGVRPDEDTTRRVARAFKELGQEERRKLVLGRYLSKFKYVHFNGERVGVRRYFSEED